MRIEIEYSEGAVRVLFTKPGSQKSYQQKMSEDVAKVFFRRVSTFIATLLKETKDETSG